MNERGLFLPAEYLPLVHPYPALIFEPGNGPTLVPVMHIAEQAAEKIVGWAASSLVKHYIDLAWIGREFGDRLQTYEFRALVQRKLDVGYAIFPAAYDALRDLERLIVPLARPREWVGPLNRSGDNGAASIRFMGPKMGFDEALDLIKRYIVPVLFPAQ